MPRKKLTEEEKMVPLPIWCGECKPMAGPFTRKEMIEHNNPSGIHANMWANGVGPPTNIEPRLRN